MHVGMAVIFQGEGEGRTDRNVYRNELRLADLAEPLGYESLWGVEHHFTDYTMCPDVLQYLTYFAGRTEKIQLGSMVVVLQWHHPMRVAEQVVMLDHVSNGRFIFGIGRGLARVEFEGFGVNQEDSREIFVENAKMILESLERGYCEFDGKFNKQKKRYIRPRPFKSFRGRTYAASVSPESFSIMAKLGIGVLIISQKPWEVVLGELNDYRTAYRDSNGVDAPPSRFGANFGSFRSRGCEPIAILDCCFMVQARAEPKHPRVKFTEARHPRPGKNNAAARPGELYTLAALGFAPSEQPTQTAPARSTKKAHLPNQPSTACLFLGTRVPSAAILKNLRAFCAA
jgi:hypothetical protein